MEINSEKLFKNKSQGDVNLGPASASSSDGHQRPLLHEKGQSSPEEAINVSARPYRLGEAHSPCPFIS